MSRSPLSRTSRTTMRMKTCVTRGPPQRAGSGTGADKLVDGPQVIDARRYTVRHDPITRRTQSAAQLGAWPTAVKACARRATSRQLHEFAGASATPMSIDPRLDIAESGAGGARAGARTLGHPRFHARQIFQWIYRRGVTDFGEMTDLAASFARQLGRAFVVATPEVVRHGTIRSTARRSSCCGSPTASRSNRSSSPTRRRMTFCISTQVGCAMGCAFCLTGKMGHRSAT